MFSIAQRIFSHGVAGFLQYGACCERRLSLVDATCDMSPNRAVTCNKSCRSVRDPFVSLCSVGMSHTSGEAAFPRPRLGQVLTPLGVNNIALARNVITAYVKLNCYICQSGRMSVIWLRGQRLWAMSSCPSMSKESKSPQFRFASCFSEMY